MSEPGPGEKGFIDTSNVSAKAIRELRKIKPKQWKEMGNSFKSVNDFLNEGGMSMKRLIGGPASIIKQQIEDTVTGLFAPLLSEISSLIGQLIDEGGLKDTITTVAKSVGDAIAVLSVEFIPGKSTLDVIMGFVNEIIKVVTNNPENVIRQWTTNILDFLKDLFGIGAGEGFAGIKDWPFGGQPGPGYGGGYGPGHYLPPDYGG